MFVKPEKLLGLIQGLARIIKYQQETFNAGSTISQAFCRPQFSLIMRHSESNLRLQKLQ